MTPPPPNPPIPGHSGAASGSVATPPAPPPEACAALARKIAERSVKVGVIGLGYVGLPLSRAFVDALSKPSGASGSAGGSGGGRVLGFDTDPEKIEALGRGRNYLHHLGADFAESLRKSGRFEATSDFSRLAECDAVLICVPTPLKDGSNPDTPEPDLSYVLDTAAEIARGLIERDRRAERSPQLVVLESTTYPGTTREEVLPILRGATAGGKGEVGFLLAFSPEREDPGRKDISTTLIPKLVGGVDAPGGSGGHAAGDLAARLYELAFARVVRVSSAEVAEAAKILENTFRAVNIALVNELKTLLDRMGIDVWEVVSAASTKPFGFMPFYPGPGLGGHCIPIDPFYLSWRARQLGVPARFIELAGQVNHAMPGYVVDRLVVALSARGRAIRNARVLVLGLAYKPDIDDIRESPSFELIERLTNLGARVDYSDPHVPVTQAMRSYDLRMKSAALTPESVAAYDAVLISTAHSAFDWTMIARHARLIVDTRNALGHIADRSNIVKA